MRNLKINGRKLSPSWQIFFAVGSSQKFWRARRARRRYLWSTSYLSGIWATGMRKSAARIEGENLKIFGISFRHSGVNFRDWKLRCTTRSRFQRFDSGSKIRRCATFRSVAIFWGGFTFCEILQKISDFRTPKKFRKLCPRFRPGIFRQRTSCAI